MIWHTPDVAPFRLAGFPWYEQNKVYRRLPVMPMRKIPDMVDHLANHTAGGQISFRSDSNQLAIKVNLKDKADMNHMPATGQCGFDLYIGPPFAQRFHSTTKYDHLQTTYEVSLFTHPEKDMRDFTLNFPLYQGVEQVQVGLIEDAVIEAPQPWLTDKRIILYGTSITQGGCATRPGMAYTNILSRTLHVECVNQGFSGSGRGESDVISTIGDISNPLLFVLDYEANSPGDMVKSLAEAVHVLRSKHDLVPILIVSRIAFSSDITHQSSMQSRQHSRDEQAELVAGIRKDGDNNVHFLDGSILLGDDFDECTVDGVHPNDLGFMRMARGLEPTIRQILGM